MMYGLWLDFQELKQLDTAVVAQVSLASATFGLILLVV
jgi:hypothetical protein